MLQKIAYIISLFLLSLTLCQAQQSTTVSSSSRNQNIYVRYLREKLPSLEEKNNSVRFTIDGHHVIGFVHSGYQRIQVLYIFPINTSTADCKAKLKETAENVASFFLLSKSTSNICIQKDAKFAQIIIDTSPTLYSTYLSYSTTNAVLTLIQKVGNPTDWADNRLIWQIPCNNNRTQLEYALDPSLEKPQSIDFTISGSNPKDADLFNTIYSKFNIKLRSYSNPLEMKLWRTCTGLASSQILGANFTNIRYSKASSIPSSSIFLVKKNRLARLSTKTTLSQSNRDASTWVQSSKLSFPSKIENLDGDSSSNKTESNAPLIDIAPWIPSASPTLTPIDCNTSGIKLEAYIKSLKSN